MVSDIKIVVRHINMISLFLLLRIARLLYSCSLVCAMRCDLMYQLTCRDEERSSVGLRTCDIFAAPIISASISLLVTRALRIRCW